MMVLYNHQRKGSQKGERVKDMKELAVKEWFEEKEQEKAKRYNVYFTFTRRTEDSLRMPLVENGYVYLKGEVMEETEKARKCHIESGDILGSYNGWTCWIPKSVMA